MMNGEHLVWLSINLLFASRVPGPSHALCDCLMLLIRVHLAGHGGLFGVLRYHQSKTGHLWSHETWSSGACCLGFGENEPPSLQREVPAPPVPPSPRRGFTAGLAVEISTEALKKSSWRLVSLACTRPGLREGLPGGRRGGRTWWSAGC